MQRVIMFLLLVVIIPAGIYWAGNGFEPPLDNVSRFVGETFALRGKTAPPPPPEAQPAKKTTKKKTPEKKPPVEKKPAEVEAGKSSLERGQELYDAGKFDEAAAVLAGKNERLHALSLLGVALAHAYPTRIPAGNYYIVTSAAGSEFEGFGEEREGLLKIVSAAGRSMSLPKNAIKSRTTLPREKALARIARRVASEGVSPTVNGPRMFALIQEGLTIGRPEVVAPLIPHLLDLDERKAFLLSSVRTRVAAEHQAEIYRAFARCVVLPEEQPPETVRAPKELGNGTKTKKPRRQKSRIKDAKARELVKKGSPHKNEGKRLHKKVFLAGLKKATAKDIDDAVRELEKALEYYEKAYEIEEAGEIQALMTYCSRLAFQLRFWREQVGKR